MAAGNEKALEYTMLHYGGLVKSVVHRFLYQLPQLEEDCINDVFFAVWNNITAYQPDKNPFANWIAGVARIKALDYKRKYARQLMETSLEEASLSTQKETSCEIQIIKDEFSEETTQMLSCLKPKDQELFIRLYIEEESLEEVSHTTGMTKPVIYNRLSRGKKKMRNLFEKNKKGSNIYEG